MACNDRDRLVHRIPSVLVPLFAATGCGIDESQFTLDVCSGEKLDMLASVEPEIPVDFLELRTGEYEGYEVLDAAGEACGGADEPMACVEALAALPTDSELRGGDGYYSRPELLAYTRGDEVGAITDLGGLKLFLGAIDAAGDAAMLARMSGHDILCRDGNEVGEHSEGFVVFTTSGSGCGRGDDVEHHVVLVRADGSISVIDSERIKRGDPGCAIGRLPPGLCRTIAPAATGPVGAFFAEVAHLEAASVPAFSRLAAELALHGAPTALVRASLRARDDERRHARATARLARRFGGRPVAPRLRPTPARPLIEVLADNAAEGCVRETFGALVAHLQARRARDPQVRRVLARIAVDETRHAALSWSLAGWARARLGVVERRRTARALTDAAERLASEVVQPRDATVHALTGLPEPAEAQALFARLHAALRAEAVA